MRSVLIPIWLLAALLWVSAAGAQSPIHSPEAEEEDAADSWLDLSGQLREKATFLSAIEYDASNEAAGWFWTQRARITADVTAASWLRGRASIVSALQEGGDQSPIERNDLDLQEGYVDFGPEEAFLRVGRQELRLGSQRLVATRDGTNVRRTWDGVRAHAELGDWTVDALALELVAVEQSGIFNDSRDDGRNLIGVHTTGPAVLGEIDLYYLYAQFDGRSTIEGVGNERRHSVGTRLFGEQGPWFWDWEAIVQFGAQGANDITAWTVAANTGYRWEDAFWSPEVMLSTNIASGDSQNGDGRLGTFNALFPRGSYFSENALLGPSNFYNVHPYLRARPRDDLLIFVDVNLFWRLQTDDGVYGPPGNLIRLPSGSDERFVDLSVSAGSEWEVTDHLFISVLYTHSMPQTFIEQTGVADAVSFVEFTVDMSF